MKTNVTQILQGIDGNPLRIGETDVTFRVVSVAALNAVLREDEGMPGQVKAELFFLAQKIYNADEPELSTEELAVIKDRVGRVYPQAIVGPFYTMLEATKL